MLLSTKRVHIFALVKVLTVSRENFPIEYANTVSIHIKFIQDL